MTAGRAVIRWASCRVFIDRHPARVPHMPRWLRQPRHGGRA